MTRAEWESLKIIAAQILATGILPVSSIEDVLKIMTGDLHGANERQRTS